MSNFVELSSLFPWASKLRKSYKRLCKVSSSSEDETEKRDAFKKLLTRSVRLVGKYIGDDVAAFRRLENIESLMCFLKQLIIVLNEGNLKLQHEYENLDDHLIPIFVKYVRINVFNASKTGTESATIHNLVSFLKSLPCHPEMPVTPIKRAKSILSQVHSYFKPNTAPAQQSPKTSGAEEKRTEKSIGVDEDQISESENGNTSLINVSGTQPLEDSVASLSNENEKMNLQGKELIPGYELTRKGPVSVETDEETEGDTVVLDEMETAVSNDPSVPNVQEPVELGETKEPEGTEITNMNAESESEQPSVPDAVPPSPASSASSCIFNSTKVSFNRCLVLPQGIVNRQETVESPRRVVAETPEPPDSDRDDPEIVETVALIHPTPTEMPATSCPSIDGISPISWEKSTLNMADGENSSVDDPLATARSTSLVESIAARIRPEERTTSPENPSEDSNQIKDQNPPPNPQLSDPIKRYPVQLSAVRALLRRRFRNPFITPTEKFLYQIQRKLGRLKRRPRRPVWTVSKNRALALSKAKADIKKPPVLDKSSESPEHSQSLLTAELDRSLRILEREEAGNPTGKHVSMSSQGSHGDNSGAGLENVTKAHDSLLSSNVEKQGSDSCSDTTCPLVAEVQSDSGCDVHVEDCAAIAATGVSENPKSDGQISPCDKAPTGERDAEKFNSPAGPKDSNSSDILGCSASESDVEFMDEIRTSIAAWVAHSESHNPDAESEEDVNSEMFNPSNPPNLVQLDECSPAPPAKACLNQFEDDKSSRVSRSPDTQTPKQESRRRSSRLASLYNSSNSSNSSSTTPAKKRRNAEPEFKTGSGLVKIDNIVVWDDLQKYLPSCWIDLLQQHVRDCNESRQFLVTENPGRPSTITCQCTLPSKVLYSRL